MGWLRCRCCSGNRNFEGRISPEVRANYLMSPPLVVAYALAGHIEHDFDTEPLGQGKDGKPVYLRDIWPTQEEVSAAVNSSIEFGDVPAPVRDGLGRRSELAESEVSDRGYVRVGAGFDLYPQGSLLRRDAGDACSGRGYPWGARAGGAGRFGDDGPYFAGGFDQAEWACGEVPDGAWGEACGLQQLWFAARQP